MPATRSSNQRTSSKGAVKKSKTSPKATPTAAIASSSPSPPSPPALFFWRESTPETGWLSQWYQCDFTDTDGIVYKSAEHYMMYQKAMLFSDPETAALVLNEFSPRQVRSLGRQVANFDDSTWHANRERIVTAGTRLKFTRAVNEEGLRRGEAAEAPLVAPLTLRGLLLSTGEREIVEASPMDRIWGVGFGAAKAEGNRARWGLNLLGKALMVVREEFRREDEGGAEAREEK